MLPESSAIDSASSLTAAKPKTTPVKRKRVIESEDEDEEDIEDEEVESEEDEETEEDRAFINDGRVEKSELDTAAVDAKNILPEDETGGRPKRQRKAPVRWEHPDADTVMRKFCDKWKVTDKDIEEIFQEEEDEKSDDDDDRSFHTDDDLEEDDAVEDDNEDENEDEEDETEVTEEDMETEEEEEDD